MIQKCDTNWQPMSVEEWKERLVNWWGGDCIRYREAGRHGWSRLNVDEGNINFNQVSGPHWEDAIPCRDNPVPQRYLLGSYDHNASEGRFFFQPIPACDRT